MEIGDAGTRDSAIKMSAFPMVKRPFTEPISATQDAVIGQGKTLPDLIRTYYPGTMPQALQGNFSFLDRDNKERRYAPAIEDKFVFRNAASISHFSEHAKHLIKIICDLWTEIGLPVTKDKDRGIDVPDAHVAWDALDPKHPLHDVVIKNRDAIMFLNANCDIMKKACVVRTVNPGWWAVSYKGKTSTQPEYFRQSLNAHKRAYQAIIKSKRFRDILQELAITAGDPIYSNPGYPFFAALVDKEANPVTRIKTVEVFSGLNPQSKLWEDVIEEIDRRGGKYGMAGFPLCVGPLRRQQPGYKWQHQFITTAAGLVTAFDERGVNSQRVAWMVPYVYNLLLTPFQLIMKAFRMMLPGLYHDGRAKRLRNDTLKLMHKSGRLYIAEADYSNYDRFIPVDMIRELVHEMAKSTDRPEYWEKAAMYLHDDANLVWPDYSSMSQGNGWLFKPGLLGLMSGVKITSETGTMVNSIVNAQVLSNVKGWSEDQLFTYLTQYLTTEPGSKKEYYYVQSDDTLLIADTPQELKALGDEFMIAVKAAGLKGAVEFGDRFLMRHMQAGGDRPVPARVWQNTLSNESPPEHELVFLAGMGARTDGLYGIKTVDPFNTGVNQVITRAELIFTQEVTKSLHFFISNAAVPSKTAVNLLNTMLNIPDKGSAEGVERPGSYTKVTSPYVKTLHDIRHDVVKALADYELTKALEDSKLGLANNFSWLYQLYKDKNIPSQALLLNQLLLMQPDLSGSIEKVAQKETAFFNYATKTIGISLDILN